MVSEITWKERLKKYNINIKTKYMDGDKILERNTDNSLNNNIHSGIILEKDYYCRGQLLKKENIFDSRMLYSYEFNNDKTITCNNCGMTGDIDEFSLGCPYCHTNYNIEFDNKELGSKHYYDLVTKSHGYIFITFIIDFIICFIFSLILVLSTSRTFYLFDVLKVVIITILLSFLLFYVFYYFDAFLIAPSVRRKKEKQNRRQELFWNKMRENNFDKIKFYNNFIFDLRKLYYSDKYPNIIDFDIIDYNSFNLYNKDNKTYVEVCIEIRIVEFVNGKINSYIKNETYKLLHQSLDKELSGGINLIKCHNCGCSINVLDNKCSYCGTEFNYYQEWYII